MNVDHAKVLIVDDVEANVALLIAILSRAGFGNVEGLTDARSVLSHVERSIPDIVLLDLHMPHLDGLAVLEALSKRFGRDQKPPVVFLTADITSQTRQAALTAGANDFLTKPFDHIEVVLRIRNLVTTRLLHRELQQRNDDLEREVAEQRARDGAAATERTTKQSRILDVLHTNAIEMLFQPIVELHTGLIAGFESLARFHHPLFRSPDAWFTEAAEIGLGLELELAAVSRAIAAIPLLPPGSHLAVNVSAATATSAALLHTIAEASSERIVVELTEHTQVEDYAVLQRHLDQLRSLGVLVAVDDAGTGFAGLQHILRIRPDVVKLDRDLITGIDTDPARYALASALGTFAREIGAVLVAEGIETGPELQVLRELGVPWGQGFYLAPPAPAGTDHHISIEIGSTS